MTMKRIAGVYSELGRHDDALSTLVKVSHKIKKNLGTDHFSFALVLSKISGVYTKLGKHKEALEACMKIQAHSFESIWSST